MLMHQKMLATDRSSAQEARHRIRRNREINNLPDAVKIAKHDLIY